LRLKHHCTCCVPAVLLLALTLGSASARAGEPAAPADVPDWALAALTVREFGNGLEKAGAYCEKLLPNSSELAKQTLTSFLFNLPVDAGLKNDGTATIYALDPVATATKDERAFVLPVADAGALRTALVNTYGAPTQGAGGTMTFVLPQPLPQPDKNLVVKLIKDKVLAAPSILLVNKLEDYLADHPGGPFARIAPKGAALPDAVLTFKVASFKRVYGDALEASLQAAATVVARDGKIGADALQARMANVLASLWQLEALEAQLELDPAGTKAALEIRALPVLGTPLANLLSEPATPTSGKLLGLMPPEPAFAATWNMNGTQWARMLRAELDNQGQPAKPEVETMRALLDLLLLASSEMALALNGSANDGAGLLFGLQASDPQKALPATEAVFQAATKLMETMAAAGTAPFGLKQMPAAFQGGVALQRYQLESTAAAAPKASSLLGWPLTVQFALTGNALALTAGKQGLDTLKQAVEQAKALAAGTAVPPAGKDGPLSILANLGPGTFAAVTLYPVRLGRLALAAVPPDAGVDAAKLSAGLTDSPAVLSLRQTENLFALRLDLPSAAPHAVYNMAQRYENAVARNRRNKAPEAVPAPPPP